MSRLPPFLRPAADPPPTWTPTRVVRLVADPYATSMGTARVETDAGLGYLKALGNRQGPHCLASELVATELAGWFGLFVAAHAVIELPAEDCYDLPGGGRTRPGPAFVSRHVDGETWSGLPASLAGLVNPRNVTRLVVFDTWVRNCDRHPPDTATRRPNYANVYLAATDRAGRHRLTAIDHTHCFDCGRDLAAGLADIGRVRDEQTYGLFPAFAPLLDRAELLWCGGQLRTLQPADVRSIVGRLPRAWDVPDSARAALADFIVRRAVWLADRIEQGWSPAP